VVDLHKAGGRNLFNWKEKTSGFRFSTGPSSWYTFMFSGLPEKVDRIRILALLRGSNG
jgi:hypothetical protein